MSRISSTGASRAGVRHGDGYDGIAEPLAPRRSPAVNRNDLSPWEETASLPPAHPAGQETLAPLTRFLGAALTVANPAWSRDPLPGLRALQKRLVDYSLALDQAERGDSLAAIMVVEDAVRLRLRLQQMDLARYGADQGAAA
ncbi:hypothetical protein INH39_30525 [Massilia violaceinigra]|uniref:Uncharacterized protein n=1 Tax=Massilia violaceinigra TaxID=2045208 RepID=A0ABY4A4K6_9BURK|nr:hypothetical protein [Massilia violaceinigra]UOD29672.1 hypothetical protein INH39_30525 [Massilia violaceinigra]